jgi:hypothetical protein
LKSISCLKANQAYPIAGGTQIIFEHIFGSVFTGNATWLAISVRSNGVGNCTAMTPLQELTPASYAIFAGTASNLSGTVSNAQLAGSSITVTAGTGLAGGGTVPLGGSTSLANAGVLSITGTHALPFSNLHGQRS